MAPSMVESMIFDSTRMALARYKSSFEFISCPPPINHKRSSVQAHTLKASSKLERA